MNVNQSTSSLDSLVSRDRKKMLQKAFGIDSNAEKHYNNINQFLTIQKIDNKIEEFEQLLPLLPQTKRSYLQNKQEKLRETRQKLINLADRIKKTYVLEHTLPVTITRVLSSEDIKRYQQTTDQQSTSQSNQQASHQLGQQANLQPIRQSNRNIQQHFQELLEEIDENLESLEEQQQQTEEQQQQIFQIKLENEKQKIEVKNIRQKLDRLRLMVEQRKQQNKTIQK